MKMNNIKQFLIITFVTAITSNLSIAQTGKVHSNGITIAYEAFGNKDNEAIILIQGTGGQLCFIILKNYVRSWLPKDFM